MGDVVLSFNAKAQNSVGLTWANGYLWNIDHGHYVPAKLLKLDPTDGSVLLTLTLPITHGMGLTWDGNSFWVVSHEDSVIYQINPNDGSIISSFGSPNPFTVETGCEGLAWDGTYLWYADSDLDTIYQLDPSDGSVVKSFSTPGPSAQGLVWDGSHLWHFDVVTGLIYELSPIDGSVLTSFPAPGKGEGDLAWDGCYLWLSRNAADTIYKIDVGGPATLDAVIDIDPNTLNLKSKGRWITCYIELPVGYNVTNIDANTILLEDTLPPILDPKYGFVKSEDSYIMDHDNDTLPERMVKFDRSEVEDMLLPGTYNLKVTGLLIDGTQFAGYSDIITVIEP